MHDLVGLCVVSQFVCMFARIQRQMDLHKRIPSAETNASASAAPVAGSKRATSAWCKYTRKCTTRQNC